jgi:hypothetical protein
VRRKSISSEKDSVAPSPPSSGLLSTADQEQRDHARHDLLMLVRADERVEQLFLRWDQEAGVLSLAKHVQRALAKLATILPDYDTWEFYQRLNPEFPDDYADQLSAKLSSVTGVIKKRLVAASQAIRVLHNRRKEITQELSQQALAWTDSTLRLPYPWLAARLVGDYFYRIESSHHLTGPLRIEPFSVRLAPGALIHVPPLFGDPRDRETRRRLIKAVDAALEEAAREMRGHTPRRHQGAELRKYVSWFYRHHALGHSVRRIARDYHRDRGHPRPVRDCDDRPTIRYGIKKAQAVLDVPPGDLRRLFRPS